MAKEIRGAYTNVRTTTAEIVAGDDVVEIVIPANSIVLEFGGLVVEDVFSAGTIQMAVAGSNAGSAVDATASAMTPIAGVKGYKATETSITATLAGASASVTGKAIISVFYAHLDEVSGAYYGIQG